MEYVSLAVALAAFISVLWLLAKRRARYYDVALRLNREAACWLCLPLTLLCAGGVNHSLLVSLCVVTGACVSAATDRQTGYIFDVVLGACFLATVATRISTGELLTATFLGMTACGGCMMLIRAITGGRGMGLGDVKLALLVGSLGPVVGAIAIGSAFVVGAVFALVSLMRGYHRFGEALPFGPYLAVGVYGTVAAGALGW